MNFVLTAVKRGIAFFAAFAIVRAVISFFQTGAVSWATVITEAFVVSLIFALIYGFIERIRK